MSTRNIFGLTLRLLTSWAVAFVVNNAIAADPPPPPPIVVILATDPVAGEAGPDSATFTVYRIGPANTSLTVQYQTAGTALNGLDYAALPGSVTIPAGAYGAPITVSPIDDSLVEGAEIVAIFLEQPAVWPPPYLVAWPSYAVGQIEDNDLPPTNQPPVVRLVNPPDGAVLIAPVDILLVANAKDSDGRVVTVEFFDGTNSLGIVTNRPRVIRPHLIAADVLELADELDPDAFPELDAVADVVNLPSTVFRLLWENAPPGPHTLTAVATDNQGASTRSAPVRIRITEPPPRPVVNVRASDPEATEPDPIGSRLDTATFTINRSGRTDIPLTVFYRLGGTASNGVDYSELPHSVTIPMGARRAAVIVEPLDDALVEGDETVVIEIAAPICVATDPPPPDCYLVGRHHTARAVIHDNDRPNHPPVVRLVRPEDGSVFFAPADIGLAAQARDFDGEVVTVEFFEGTNSLGIVTNRQAALALTPNTPLFSLKWPNVPPGHYILHAVATDNDGDSARSRPVEIKVVERTLPPTVSIAATDADAAEVLPPGTKNTATFTVSRTGPTDRSLLVFYDLGGSAENSVDYDKLSGRVLIPAGAPSAPVVIAPIDDRLVEGVETVKIALLPPICVAIHPAPADCYLVGPNDSAGATIRDNDLSPTNIPPKVAIVRPQEGDVFVAAADIVLYAETRDDGWVRTVEFFANGTSIGIASNSLSAIGLPDTTAAASEQVFRLAWNNVPAGGYALTAKATDNRGAMTLSAPVHIRVIERILPAVVSIEAVDPYASECDGPLIEFADITPVQPANLQGDVEPMPIPIPIRPNNATFVVKRDRGTNIDLTVYYSLHGTAENGSDYRKLDGKVTIPRGAWRAAITVDPIEDDLVEGTESVIIALEPPVCIDIFPPPASCYRVGDPGRDIAWIRDCTIPNRPPRVAIVRPETGDLFREKSDIQIIAQARDADGYVPRLEFFANGVSIGVQEILFIVAPPPGQVQRFSMVWSNVSAGRYGLTAKATDDRGASSRSGEVWIGVIDVDPIPLVSIAAVDAFAREGATPPNTATFSIRRGGETNNPLTVFFSIHGTAGNGVDYVEIPTSVTIPAGRRGARIVVTPLDDRRLEPTETVILRLEDSHSYDLGRHRRASAIIVDNDRSHPGHCVLPDGLVHLFQSGDRGRCYRLEGSDDLTTWETFVECLLDDDGMHFIDPESLDRPRRFFRLVAMELEEIFHEE